MGVILPNRTQELTTGLQTVLRPIPAAAATQPWSNASPDNFPLPGSALDKTDYLVPPPAGLPIPKPGAAQRPAASRDAIHAEEFIQASQNVAPDAPASPAFIAMSPDKGAELFSEDAADPSGMPINTSEARAKGDSSIQARYAHRTDELNDLRIMSQIMEKAMHNNPEFAAKYKDAIINWTPALHEKVVAWQERNRPTP